MDGSSVVLHTRFSSVVFPAFALPITRMRKRVYLARSFAASSSSFVTVGGGVAGGTGATEGSAICGNEVPGGKQGSRWRHSDWWGKRTDGRTLRSKSKDLLQSIAKSFGLFDGMLAIIIHLDEGRR